MADFNLIMRADAPNANKVSIVQGSGSGHEPAHVMIVGKGMLDAACPGGAARWENRATTTDAIIDVITAGIWSPRTVTIECVEGGGK